MVENKDTICKCKVIQTNGNNVSTLIWAKFPCTVLKTVHACTRDKRVDDNAHLVSIRSANTSVSVSVKGQCAATRLTCMYAS